MLRRLFKADFKAEDDLLGHGSELSAEQALHRQLSGVEEMDASPKVAAEYPLHRAAFENDVAKLRELLPTLSRDDKLALDPQGNTALHVAVLRRHSDAVRALLDGGVPPDFKNAQRWTAIDEAVALRDAPLTKMMYAWLVSDVKRQMKEKKETLLGVLRELPDFTMKLRWELGSPLFGLLLRRYAPDDTYTLSKSGTQLRVSGTLMGIDHEAHSLLPTWKRGNFSLLLDAAPTPATLVFVDHEAQHWVDLTAERKKKPRDLDLEVRELLADGASKVKWKSSEVVFQRSKTWLGRPAKEKVEGWNTQLWECGGRLVAVEHRKPHVSIPAGASWDDYLAMPLPEDEREEFPIDPMAGPPGLKPGSSGSGHHGTRDSVDSLEEGAAGPKSQREQHSSSPPPRRVSGKCWMAEDFPMSLRQLLPLLEVVGNANKHVGRMASFMQRFSDVNLFPVRVQIPIAWTVYLLLSFRDFRTPKPGEGELAPEVFKVPPGFKQVELKELGEREAGGKEQKGGTLGALAGGDFEI